MQSSSQPLATEKKVVIRIKEVNMIIDYKEGDKERSRTD
jgi:hypothetical protein